MSQCAREAVVIPSYRAPPSQACTLRLATIGVYDVTLDPVHKTSCRLRALPVKLTHCFPFASTSSSPTATSEQQLGATSNGDSVPQPAARSHPSRSRLHSALSTASYQARALPSLPRRPAGPGFQFELRFPLRVRSHVPPKLSPRLDSLDSRHRGFSHRLRLPASAAKRRRDVSGSIDCVFTVRIQTVLVGGARAVSTARGAYMT